MLKFIRWITNNKNKKLINSILKLINKKILHKKTIFLILFKLDFMKYFIIFLSLNYFFGILLFKVKIFLFLNIFWTKVKVIIIIITKNLRY